MFKAVIFDVDGTLLDTERLYMQGWREGAALLGYPMPEEALLKTRAVRIPEAIKVFQHYCGADFPYDAVRKERTRISEEIIENSTSEELCKPNVHKLLRHLASKGIPMAVASSTAYEKTVSHLEHAGLMSYFQAAVGGDMIENGKPAPDIFLKAAQLLGVTPEDCLVVGDTPADVLAASAANMKVILIPDQVPPNEQTIPLSWKILPDLWDVAEAMEG